MKSAVFIVASLIGSLCSRVGDAQPLRRVEPVAAGWAGECRLAAQVLRTGHPAPKLAWATIRAPECAEMGPPALAFRWRSISGEPSETGELMRASMRVRDGRLYSQLLQVVTEGARPAQVRVAAMLVLAKYVDPSNGVVLDQLVPPDSIGRIRIVSGSTTNTSYSRGSVSMPDSIGPQVLAMLERLAEDRAGQPREVWYAAARLARRVRFDIEHSPATP